MLGHEVRGRVRDQLAGDPPRRRARRSRSSASAHLDTRQPLSSLSLAMQQLVAISRAMVTDSKVLILDEPTSSLDANEVEQLFAVVRRLRDQGVAILFVSHFLDQVYAISDRITVLRNGSYVGEYLTRELDRTALISKMIGKELAVLASLDAERAGAATDRATEAPLLSAPRASAGKGSIDADRPRDPQRRGRRVRRPARIRSHRARPAALRRRPAGHRQRSRSTASAPSTSTRPAAGLAQRIAFSSENRRDEGIIARPHACARTSSSPCRPSAGGRGRCPAREKDEIVSKYMTELERPARRPEPRDARTSRAATSRRCCSAAGSRPSPRC